MPRRYASKNNLFMPIYVRSFHLLAVFCMASSVAAAETKDTVFDGKRYIVSIVDLDKEFLELFLRTNRAFTSTTSRISTAGLRCGNGDSSSR
jgi:hypothetical protein